MKKSSQKVQISSQSSKNPAFQYYFACFCLFVSSVIAPFQYHCASNNTIVHLIIPLCVQCNTAVSPLFNPSFSTLSSTFHRICIEFASSLQRRKSGGTAEEQRRNSGVALGSHWAHTGVTLEQHWSIYSVLIDTFLLSILLYSTP